MNISPVQVRNLAFRKVFVEVDVARLSDGSLDGKTQPWDFEGEIMHTKVGIADAEDTEGAPSFYLTLHVKFGEVSDDSKSLIACSPYLVDIEVGGVVLIGGDLSTRSKPEIQEIAAINGASVLWSAIREQVANITGRMPPGLAILPTVNFLDLRGTPPTPQAQ